jgi:putative protease
MMISRIPLRGIKSDRHLVSDRGEAYRVDQRAGLTTVRPGQDFSLLGHCSELKDMGCQRFVVDISHVGTGSALATQILSAISHDTPLEGTSSFNYLQEMV